MQGFQAATEPNREIGAQARGVGFLPEGGQRAVPNGPKIIDEA